MTSRWWYGVAIGSMVWAVFVLVPGPESALGGQATEALNSHLAVLALLAWPAIPACISLDRRATREATAWDPSTRWWLLVAALPFVNASAGAAYCLRRPSALRGAVPSPRWRFVAAATYVGWVGIVAADALGESVALGALEPVIFEGLLFVVWLAFPVAVYLDAERGRAATDLDPNLGPLVALAAVPLVNLLVGAAYLGARWWHRHTADDPGTVTLPAAGGDGSAARDRISPWYRRAAASYAVYFLAMVLLGMRVPAGSDLAWSLLALVVWPLFGVPFTACVHYDIATLRDAGVVWGRTRYVYYLGVVIPALAFWYLLIRATKTNRARREGWLGEGGAETAADLHPGSAQGDGDVDAG